MKINTFCKQKHKHGCAIACIAMVANCSYEDVLKLIPNHNFNKSGITPESVCSILCELGFKTELKYKTVLHSQKKRPLFHGDNAFYRRMSSLQIIQIDNHFVVAVEGFIYDVSRDFNQTGIENIINLATKHKDFEKTVISIINIFKT